MSFDDRRNIGPYKPLAEYADVCNVLPPFPSPPPSAHELADAVRELLAAIDDPRHNIAWSDIGEGVNVGDKRAKVEHLLSRV